MTDTPEQKKYDPKMVVKNLTGSQKEELQMISHIMAREIQKNGSFSDKLDDYSYAYSKSQDRVTAEKANGYIRAQFQVDHGQTMKDMMDKLRAKEEKLDEHSLGLARNFAHCIEKEMKAGDVPFYLAYDNQGRKFAEQFGVTERKAKSLIKTSFEDNSEHDFYNYHKGIEKIHYKSEPRAETQEQQRARSQSR